MGPITIVPVGKAPTGLCADNTDNAHSACDLLTEDRERRWRPHGGFVPSGTRWVHIRPAARGAQRARAVTTCRKGPQVRQLAKPRPGSTSGSGSEFESPHPHIAIATPRDATITDMDRDWMRDRLEEFREACEQYARSSEGQYVGDRDIRARMHA